MMRHFALMATIITTYPGLAGAEFSLDMPADAIMSAAGKTILKDLTVGDKAYARPSALCSRDGKLFVDGWDEIIAEKSTYGPNMLVTRQVKSAFSVDIEVGPDTVIPGGSFVTTFFAKVSDRPCNGLPYERYQPVESVDGFTSTSAMFQK